MNTAEAIALVCTEVRDLLIEKNRKYGDSAINPTRIFSKASPREQLLVRMDDKLSRIKNAQPDDGEDALLDLLGYLVLERVQRKIASSKPDKIVPKFEPTWGKFDGYAIQAQAYQTEIDRQIQRISAWAAECSAIAATATKPAEPSRAVSSGASFVELMDREVAKVAAAPPPPDDSYLVALNEEIRRPGITEAERASLEKEVQRVTERKTPGQVDPNEAPEGYIAVANPTNRGLGCGFAVADERPAVPCAAPRRKDGRTAHFVRKEPK